jgi:hypothetical protein
MMVKTFLISFFCGIGAFFFAPDTYLKRYPKEYAGGEFIIRSKLKLADSVCSRFRLSSKYVLPIVFPECTRFSSLSDRIESSANYYLYCTLGEKYANFSIGHFQMKPSFVEQLEKSVLASPSLSHLHYIADFGKFSKDESAVRKLRISRLESDWWQMQYLCCFYLVMDNKYPASKWKNQEEKLSFYAAAFNRGFFLSEQKILDWMSVPAFPNGSSAPAVNFPYSSIALEYFRNFTDY